MPGQGYPNEACGLIIGDRPAARRRPRRCASSRRATRPRRPYRYEIDPDDLYRLTIATDDADEVFWAIVHRIPTLRPSRRRPTSGSPSTPTRSTSSSRSRRTRPTLRPARRACAPGGSWTASATRSSSRSSPDDRHRSSARRRRAGDRPRPGRCGRRARSWAGTPDGSTRSSTRHRSSAPSSSVWASPRA